MYNGYRMFCVRAVSQYTKQVPHSDKKNAFFFTVGRILTASWRLGFLKVRLKVFPAQDLLRGPRLRTYLQEGGIKGVSNTATPLNKIRYHRTKHQQDQHRKGQKVKIL